MRINLNCKIWNSVYNSNDEESSRALSDEIFSFGRSMFNGAKDFVYNYPRMSLTTFAVVFLGAYFLFYSHKNNEQSTGILTLVNTAHKLDERHTDLFVEDLIENFTSQFFRSAEFIKKIDQEIKIADLKVFLNSKIGDIFFGTTLRETKIEIIETTLKNFTTFLSDAQSRIISDIAKGKLGKLNIDKDDAIAEMLPLGEETHQAGKIPLQIRLKSGKQFVYKPRSMLPELVLSDPEEGVLGHEGFGIYRVICCEDESGNSYGYSDFIENIESENTITNFDQLSDYIHKMCLLDQIASRMGLSDLHYQNIITQHLEPFIIDAEVFLNPAHMGSGIFDEVTGSLYVFDLKKGTDPKYTGKNRLWFDQNTSGISEVDLRFGMSEEDLTRIGINVQEIRASVQLSKNTEYAIKKAIDILRNESGRIVFEDTQHLIGMQSRLDYRNPKTLNIFIDMLSDMINEEPGFKFYEESLELMREKAIEDIRNHDIPIFYYDSRAKVVLYHGVVIGVEDTADVI